MINILLIGVALAILLFTAIYDFRYQEVFILSPLFIWLIGLLLVFVRGGGTLELLVASTGGLFLFVVGLMLFITGGSGFGDALLFWSIGFLLGNLNLAMLYLGFTMISFIPFFIMFILKYWKSPEYDITWKGFLRQVKTKDLREGMVLSQSKIWRGIDKEQINALLKANGSEYKVWVKEGIPFAPAMFCGLLFVLASGVWVV